MASFTTRDWLYQASQEFIYSNKDISFEEDKAEEVSFEEQKQRDSFIRLIDSAKFKMDSKCMVQEHQSRVKTELRGCMNNSN